MLTEDVAELRRLHRANPPATGEDILRFELTWGHRLDAELRAFYLTCNGATLYADSGDPWVIHPLGSMIRRYGYAEALPHRPQDIWGLVDLPDSDRVGFRITDGPYPMVDMFHETIWYEGWEADAEVIAPSFDAFLHEALRSGGKKFWLDSRDVG